MPTIRIKANVRRVKDEMGNIYLIPIEPEPDTTETENTETNEET
jgi:hypothetical protein